MIILKTTKDFFDECKHQNISFEIDPNRYECDELFRAFVNSKSAEWLARILENPKDVDEFEARLAHAYIEADLSNFDRKVRRATAISEGPEKIRDLDELLRRSSMAKKYRDSDDLER